VIRVRNFISHDIDGTILTLAASTGHSGAGGRSAAHPTVGQTAGQATNMFLAYDESYLRYVSIYGGETYQCHEPLTYIFPLNHAIARF
jgi:hypothetical protein